MQKGKTTAKRLFYIDNLRIFLISLVVLHHFSLTYGAPGNWYYNETEAASPAVLLLTLFVATNQAFFMGMFFFVSAFFVSPSLKRKGKIKFLKERMLRLGIPLIFFYFILSPLTAFIVNYYTGNESLTFWQYLEKGIGFGFGPLWFVEALLIFTFIYLILKVTFEKFSIQFPGVISIFVTAFLIGILQFIIRIWLPVGWSMPFTEFQLPYFVQYIFLFYVGIIAYQNGWLESITLKTGKRWFIFAQVLVFLIFPLIFFLGDAVTNGPEKFMGGVNWQSFAYAVWEQIVGFSIIVGLIGISKKYFNNQRNLAKSLSAAAYGVFIFHPPVVVGISILFRNWLINPLLKFIILAPAALIACFLIALFFKKLPFLNKIL